MTSSRSNNSRDAPVRRRFLIPCGTSQIDPAKLLWLVEEAGLDRWETEEMFLPWARVTREPERYPNHPAYRISRMDFYDRFKDFADQIVFMLQDKHHRMGDWRTWENPFGAEQTTLYSLRNLSGFENWNPADDEYVLLASDTPTGYFCAALLAKALQNPEGYWRIPARNLLTYRLMENAVLTQHESNPPVTVIPQLLEQPGDQRQTNEAIKSAIRMVGKVRDELQRENARQLVFLITGGFKSLIPSLTMFSFFFGIEMIYLFETSRYPVRFAPQVDFPAGTPKGDAWQQVTSELKRQNAQVDYLKEILDFCHVYPDDVYQD